jgi:hypothetical protein
VVSRLHACGSTGPRPASVAPRPLPAARAAAAPSLPPGRPGDAAPVEAASATPSWPDGPVPHLLAPLPDLPVTAVAAVLALAAALLCLPGPRGRARAALLWPRAAAGSGRHPGLGPDVERLAAAWELAEQHGVPLAGLLAGVQRELQWRVRFAARVRAELAGPRATAAVLTGLPLLGIGLGQLVGADPLAVLRSGLLGQALLVTGVALALAGAEWSDRILRGAVPR